MLITLSAPSGQDTFNLIRLRDAQSHFEHAKALDPSNFAAQAFLEKVRGIQLESLGGLLIAYPQISTLVGDSRDNKSLDGDSDNDNIKDVSDSTPRHKRART